jgi:DNA-binding MarR family transcriptional regulator
MNVRKHDRIDHSLAQIAHQHPDLPLDGASITLRLLLLGKLVEQGIARTLAEYDLQTWELDVLGALLRQGPPYTMTAGELARNTLITCSGMTHRLDRLQQRGFIIRAPLPEDRRQVIVSLTVEGRELAYKTVSIRAVDAQNFVAGLRDSERDQLETLLRQLLLSVENLTD